MSSHAISRALCCAVGGISGIPVTVEVDIANGLPSVTVVGLTDRAIQESRERVRAAIHNAGYDFPMRRLTINLAPAELPKEGTGFDLAMPAALPPAGGTPLALKAVGLIGELDLDGSVRPIRGVLPMVRCLHAHGVRDVVVPRTNVDEALLVDGMRVVGVASLQRCVDHLSGARPIAPADARPAPVSEENDVDFSEIYGQELAKRGLEIAAAGGHNILMTGPPGSGKTLLARALVSLLPDLTPKVALEVAALYSVRGEFAQRPATSLRPPLRAPHHSVSRAGLIGGGVGMAQPGDVSLAHKGVLFLDELCEFPRSHIEALRQPLEARSITVSRARGSVTLPADISLVAAANPCPCGHWGDRTTACRCTPTQLQAYQRRLSGPLRDRIDLAVNVPRQSYREVFAASRAEDSATVRERVTQARMRQARRTPGVINACLSTSQLADAVSTTAAARRSLERAGDAMSLTTRGFIRVLRVARTIADLAGKDAVDEIEIGEALQFRGPNLDLGRAA